MFSLKQHEAADKKKKVNKKLDSELPFFITMIALLATSGFGPYTIFQKIKDLELLPNSRIEALKILKRIDILGKDPLVVMSEISNTKSAFGEFLNGWVSAIQSGGDVINYLKSKMDGTFEIYENQQKELANQVQTLVETYMTMQIVILAIYVIITATSTGGVGAAPGADAFDPLYLVMLMPPLVYIILFILGSQNKQSKIKRIRF